MSKQINFRGHVYAIVDTDEGWVFDFADDRSSAHAKRSLWRSRCGEAIDFVRDESR